MEDVVEPSVVQAQFIQPLSIFPLAHTLSARRLYSTTTLSSMEMYVTTHRMTACIMHFAHLSGSHLTTPPFWRLQVSLALVL